MPPQRAGQGMYFEFGQALQAGLDCAGDVGPDEGAVFGWVRHRAGEPPSLRVEGRPGEPVGTVLLVTGPRHDVRVGEGQAVTGFSLVHEVPRDAPGRLLIIAAGPQEAAVDLLAYDLPADVEEAVSSREWGANFGVLHAWAGSRGGAPAAAGGGSGGAGSGLFAAWLDRLPRLAAGGDWFMDFRRVRALVMPDGEVVVSGVVAAPGPAGERVEASGCALVTSPGGPSLPIPLEGEASVALEGGFVLRGRAAVPPGAALEVVVQLRQGGQAWWFRAEPSPETLPRFLGALCLDGAELDGPDPGALYAWLRGVLAGRVAALRGRLAGLALRGGPARPGGTALLFDVNDDLAARILSLLAPELEARFGRIVLAGTAAGRAAAGLLRRGRIEVIVEGDARAALAAAGRAGGAVAPIDVAALVDAAIEGDPSRLTANALPAERLGTLAALHDVAGTGEMETTLRRAVALMAGADAGALPMPAQRPDALGGLVAEHLRGLWELVPVAGAAR